MSTPHIPDALLADLAEVPGFQSGPFCAAHNRPAALSVRLHPLKPSAAFADAAPLPWCSTGRTLNQRPVFTLDPLYHAGAYYVQEASSQFLHHVLQHVAEARTGLRVLDLCAAPGGKSTLAASVLDATCMLISKEVIRTRATILEENMVRWGYPNTFVAANDPRDFTSLTEFFDIIIADVPCSGSGLFRKDDAALKNWTTENVAMCAARQDRILADVLPALKPGGVLIYSTCSYSTAEDEDLTDMVASRFGLETVPVPVPPEWGILPVVGKRQGMSGYRFLPDRVPGEGFFIAAMRKPGVPEAAGNLKFKTAHDKKAAAASAYLLDGSDFVVVPTGTDEFSAMRPGHEADFRLLEKKLYFRKVGLRLGMPGRNEWVPAHDVALSICANTGIPYIETDKDAALRYLKKEPFGYAATATGWHLVKHAGLQLGWVKLLGNRANNYLPKHWRIRMELDD
jgi:16S rRNA C967 or C1407 C5-methylase (RsmB/RsmF family)/NOL1/NOP2/fmu family ribosome biogenesis protein